MSDESNELPERQRDIFDLLYDQTLLFERDIRPDNHEFCFSEWGLSDSRREWEITGSIRNTTLLFRQELVDLARVRFPWATTIELKQHLCSDEPLQDMFFCLSPLPPLP